MKKEPMGNEREPDSWLGTTLRQTPVPGDACIDAETLAAWTDGGLTTTAAAAVELHASSCSRCAAVLAELQRSAPVTPATHVWTPARVFRWLAPLTAAATAVAIWIAVPDRPLTPMEPAPAHGPAAPAPDPANRETDTATGNVDPATRSVEPGRSDQERRARSAEPGAAQLGTASDRPVAGTQNVEPQAQFAPSVRVEEPQAQEQIPMRDALRRERASPQAPGVAADTAAEAAPAPRAPAAPPPAAARAAPSAPAASADAVAESLTATARTAFASKGTVPESASPANPLIRWRIVAFASIERSADGGKTWTKTTPPQVAAPMNTPAVTVASIRAVDSDRAVARTSDGIEFYTINGGRSWTRVQENSVAPF